MSLKCVIIGFTLKKAHRLPTKNKKFIIRKSRTAYLFSIYGYDVTVEPLYESYHALATRAIAFSMQLVGRSKLNLNRPLDPLLFLKNLYLEKGWNIEDVE
jgi:hypothetical protein